LATRRRFLAGAASAVAVPSLTPAQGAISPDWHELADGYRTPDWFRDAKFGIWAHWGPQCQPEFGDWYARLLYTQGRLPWETGETAYVDHLRRYGHPSETGFIDIIGQWKAQNWDPAYLIAKYRKAGARYFMAMGCHHDNLDLFASKHHEWNSTRVGPQRDIVGTWEPLVREAGLKFGVSNHSGHAWHWYQVAYGYDAEGPMRGRRYDAYWLRKHHGAGKYWDGLDPQKLYTGPYYVPPDGIASAQAMNEWHAKLDGEWLEGVPEFNVRFVETWLKRQKQMVEDYKPDIVFLDHAGVIEKYDVGLVILDHLLLPLEPGLDEADVEFRHALEPLAVELGVPFVHRLGRGDPVRRHVIGAGVELLRVEPVPVLAGTVMLAQPVGVVTPAAHRPLGIVAIGDLVPMPGVAGVVGDTELEPRLAHQRLPGADDVTLRTDPGAVPFMMLAGEQVEVVVVTAHCHEVSRAGLAVLSDQVGGIPVLRLPLADDVDEPGLARVAIAAQVVDVGSLARFPRQPSLSVQQPGVPVAELRLALRPPMGPDPELGVAKPVRRAIAVG
jgi:hypothetical protein